MNTVFSSRPDIGFLFLLNDQQWRVTSTTNNFVIGTRSDINGEPLCSVDVVKVSLINSKEH